MSYRKLKADYLFDGFKLYESDHVLVCQRDGTIETIIPDSQAGSEIETYSGLLSPGFINCHCHLELSHLKDKIPRKQGLADFAWSVINLRREPEEIIQAAMQETEAQMVRGGIVAVGDICNTVDSLAVKSSGQLYYYNFIELLGWSPGQALSRFNIGKDITGKFLHGLQDEIHLSLNPHAPYSVSTELWKLMIPEFPGKTITIHNQESADENEFFLNGGGSLSGLYSLLKINNDHFKAPGTHSIPFYIDKLKTASRVLLVHNTFMDEKDLTLALSSHGELFLCLCPNANLYIENRLPDIPGFIRKTSHLVLGTDSLASNKQLSILEEMKTIKQNFPSIPSSIMLTWATSNGARALQFDEKLGDFAKNKKPGIILVEQLCQGEICNNTICRRLL